ncbi:MAG TPA: Spy/CpxP family protein refolding chaperone [Phenylobacterium sp.]|jgi:hypothetical protein
MSLSRRRFPLPAAALALASVLAAAGVSVAQPSGGQYGQPGGGGDARGPAPRQSYGAGPPAELASLHATLQITAAQEPAWRAFAAASQPDPQQAGREQSARQMLPTLTSPQRVDLSLAVMEADLQTLRERGRALKTFYATLTPAQQAAFDRATLPDEEATRGSLRR